MEETIYGYPAYADQYRGSALGGHTGGYEINRKKMSEMCPGELVLSSFITGTVYRWTSIQ